MAEYGEPSQKGEPSGNGMNGNGGHSDDMIVRLDERTRLLWQMVVQMQTQMAAMPTRNTFLAGISILLATFVAISAAYWIGISGHLTGMSAQIGSLAKDVSDIKSQLHH